MERLDIPPDVLRWFRTVFAQCNKKLARTMSIVPNVSEPSLDMGLIDYLTQFGAPQVLNSGWTVRVDTHFLGGLRHFYGKWEIADIGLLVHYRKNGKTLRSKAAVLQSKRLYPKAGHVKEDLEVDYETGFARLADPDATPPLYVKTKFTFDETCRLSSSGRKAGESPFIISSTILLICHGTRPTLFALSPDASGILAWLRESFRLAMLWRCSRASRRTILRRFSI